MHAATLRVIYLEMLQLSFTVTIVFTTVNSVHIHPEIRERATPLPAKHPLCAPHTPCKHSPPLLLLGGQLTCGGVRQALGVQQPLKHCRGEVKRKCDSDMCHMPAAALLPCLPCPSASSPFSLHINCAEVPYTSLQQRRCVSPTAPTPPHPLPHPTHSLTLAVVAAAQALAQREVGFGEAALQQAGQRAGDVVVQQT